MASRIGKPNPSWSDGNSKARAVAVVLPQRVGVAVVVHVEGAVAAQLLDERAQAAVLPAPAADQDQPRRGPGPARGAPRGSAGRPAAGARGSCAVPGCRRTGTARRPGARRGAGGIDQTQDGVAERGGPHAAGHGGEALAHVGRGRRRSCRRRPPPAAGSGAPATGSTTAAVPRPSRETAGSRGRGP